MNSWVRCAAAEREPEPWAGIDTSGGRDGALSRAHIGIKPRVRQQRHAGVVEGVIAHEVSELGQSAGEARVRLDPPALEEERRSDIETVQDLDDCLVDAGIRRPVGMLGVEGEGNAERRCRSGYFSTPVMTTPLMKNRWNSANRITGRTSVIMVPAWMNAGFW